MEHNFSVIFSMEKIDNDIKENHNIYQLNTISMNICSRAKW